MSKVSRSVYQKVCEEKKKLLADIEILVMEGLTAEGVLCKIKWKRKFREDIIFNAAMKCAAIQHVKNNPNQYPKFLTDQANKL